MEHEHQRRVLGVVIAACSLALLALPSAASALDYQGRPPYFATNPQNIGEVTRLTESLGAYDIPGTPASPGSVGSGAGWSTTYLVDPPGTSQKGDSLLNDLWTRLRRNGTLPKLAKFGVRALGPAGGFVLWVTGGDDYILGKIFSPPDPAPGPVWNIDKIVLADRKEVAVSRQCYVTSACDDQTQVAYRAPATISQRIFLSSSNQADFYYCSGEGNHSSVGEMVGSLPSGALAVETYTESPTGSGTCGNRVWQHFSIVGDISPAEFAPFGNPIGPGGSQIDSLSSAPCTTRWLCPTADDIQQRVADELNSGEYPNEAHKDDSKSEPLLIPDPNAPITNDQNQHRCDRSPPNLGNPAGNTVPDPFDVYDPVPYETAWRPDGYEAAPNPYLRYGFTEWLGGFQDNWSPWGWRHIQAKHGWSLADQADTRSALSNPPLPPIQFGSRMEYTGQPYVQNGANCARRVVVEYLNGHGIWTSYGRYFGEAP